MDENIQKDNKPYVKWMEDYRSGDPGKKQMAITNMCLFLEKWVHVYARKYGTYVCDQDDLVQEGMLAIIKHMDRYDATKYVPITYFTTHIHGAMHDYIAKQQGLKRNDFTNKNKIDRAVEQLKEMGQKVTIDNIVRLTDDRITREVIFNNMAVFRATSDQIRIDKDTENDYNILDGFVQNTETPEQAYEKQEKQEIITNALSKLTEEERAVILSLFYEENTVAETMNKLSLTSSEVKKHRTSAYIKLQHSPSLKNYLGIHISMPVTDTDNFFCSDSVDLMKEMEGLEIDFGEGVIDL